MTGPILQVRNLSKSFDRRRMWFDQANRAAAVSQVSFDVDRGRTFGLVGESGSGKTTVARLLARLTEADEGSVRFAGTDLRALKAGALRQARRRIQIVAQDPAAAFDPRVRLHSAIADPIRLHRLRPERDMAARVAELLAQVGLPADLTGRFPHELSGGQLQRLAIARALAVEPDVVILDEVASALDVLVKAQILDLLRTLQRGLGMTYVFISHNMADVDLMADAVGVLFCGRMVETGTKADVFGTPRHPYTAALLTAASGGQGDAPLAAAAPPSQASKSGCAYAGRCPMALALCRESQPMLERVAEKPPTVLPDRRATPQHPDLTGTPRRDHLQACLRAAEFRSSGPMAGFNRPLSAQARLRLELILKASGPSAGQGGATLRPDGLAVPVSPLDRIPDAP